MRHVRDRKGLFCERALDARDRRGPDAERLEDGEGGGLVS